MSHIKSKDTKPEMIIRRLLHRAGYRYSLHKSALPGKPDLYFKKFNAAIFIHGCFWHQHPGCKRASIPKSNTDYWIPKLKRNVERDRDHINDLELLGIRVLVIWECETNLSDLDDQQLLLDRIRKFLDPNCRKVEN